MSPRKERLPGDYKPGGLRAGIVMLIVIVVAVALIWYAFSWALSNSGGLDFPMPIRDR